MSLAVECGCKGVGAWFFVLSDCSYVLRASAVAAAAPLSALTLTLSPSTQSLSLSACVFVFSLPISF